MKTKFGKLLNFVFKLANNDHLSPEHRIRSIVSLYKLSIHVCRRVCVCVCADLSAWTYKSIRPQMDQYIVVHTAAAAARDECACSRRIQLRVCSFNFAIASLPSSPPPRLAGRNLLCVLYKVVACLRAGQMRFVLRCLIISEQRQPSWLNGMYNLYHTSIMRLYPATGGLWTCLDYSICSLSV